MLLGGVKVSKAWRTTTVGLRIFEALVYAVGKTLNESGVQSQIVLQDMGKQITERLVEVGRVEITNDPFKDSKDLSRFFSSTGLIDDMILSREGSVLIVEWRNWRLLNSIRRLMSKGHNLIPCPLTMAVFSVFRENGFALEPLSELQVVDDSKRTATQKFTLIDLKSRSFEEESDRVSRAMDSEFKSPT